MKKIVNIAIIGCGPMSKLHHIPAVNSLENVELYAICDNDSAILDEAYEIAKTGLKISDYRELVNDSNLDAVLIATPDQFHPEITEAFLRAGKAVLCEKPMALTSKECLEMIDVERETNGKLTIGQICRVTPGFMKAKELVDAGRIGELTFVESEYAHNYANTRGSHDWRLHPLRHIMLGGGCHAIDLLRWIAGDPTEVYGYHNHKCLTDWPTPDTSVAIFKFPNDVIGKVFASSGVKRNYTMRTVLYGTKGTIICDNTSPTIQLFEDSQGREWWGKPEEIPVNIKSHNAAAEILLFAEALVNGDAMPISSSEGAKTVIAAESAIRAMNEGKPVEIDYLGL